MRSKKARKYTKCRMHGGASAGPRSPEGLERCTKTNWKQRLAERIAERRALRRTLQWIRLQTDQLERELRVILRERKRQQRADQHVPLITSVFVSSAPNDRDV